MYNKVTKIYDDMKKFILLFAIVAIGFTNMQAQTISKIYGKRSLDQTYINLKTDTLFVPPGTSLWNISMNFAFEYTNGTIPLEFGDVIVYDFGVGNESIFQNDSTTYAVENNLAANESLQITCGVLMNVSGNAFVELGDSTYRLTFTAELLRISKYGTMSNTMQIIDAIVCMKKRPAPSSINESSIEKVRLFPNPVNSNLNITNLNNTKVEIFNVVGQRILTYANANGNLNVDMTAYPNGIYFVKIQSGKSVRTEKIKLVK